MRATDSQRTARRLYLELRARGAKVKTRPHPRKPGYQLGVIGMRPRDAEHARALTQRVESSKQELIALVRAEGEDPDAGAVLEEGAE